MSLSELVESELELILSWRNLPQVRKVMFTNHQITQDEHRRWFQKISDDESALWLVYRNDDLKPEGVVYFTSVNARQRTAFWGFYCAESILPGTANVIELEALDFAFKKLGLRKLNCEVLDFNKSVVNMHVNAGFVREGVFRKEYCDGSAFFDVIRLGMLDVEWELNRPLVVQKIEKFKALVRRKREN